MTATFACCSLTACSACLMMRVNSHKVMISHLSINSYRTFLSGLSLRHQKDRVWSSWFNILLDRQVPLFTG